MVELSPEDTADLKVCKIPRFPALLQECWGDSGGASGFDSLSKVLLSALDWILPQHNWSPSS